MKVLIIGSNGIIGSKIISNLNQKRYKVFLINRSKPKFKKANYFRIDYYKEKKKIKKLIDKHKFEIVINLICYNRNQAKRDYNLFKRHISKYIFISSTSVYKNTREKINEQSLIQKKSDSYVMGKIEAENFFRFSTNNFPFIILRICQIYGNDNIPTLFKKRNFSVLNDMYLNKRIILIKNFKNIWKILSANDLGKIISKIIYSKNTKLFKNIFNIVPDKTYTWEKIYKIYSKVENDKFRVENISLEKIKKQNKDIYQHLIFDKLKNANFENKKIFKIIPKPKFSNFDKKIIKIIKEKKEKIIKIKQDNDIRKIFKFSTR